MPAVQTTYTTTMRPALAGMKADMLPERIISRVVEGASGLGFGVAVYQGTGDRQVKAADGTALFVGVTLLDPTVMPVTSSGTVDTFPTGDVCPVMIQGTVWVVAGATIAAGALAYAVNATGVFTSVSTAATLIGRFRTSAASSALVLLDLT